MQLEPINAVSNMLTANFAIAATDVLHSLGIGKRTATTPSAAGISPAVADSFAATSPDALSATSSITSPNMRLLKVAGCTAAGFSIMAASGTTACALGMAVGSLLLTFPALAGGTYALVYSRSQKPGSLAQVGTWAVGCAAVGVSMASLSLSPTALFHRANLATGVFVGVLSLLALVAFPDRNADGSGFVRRNTPNMVSCVFGLSGLGIVQSLFLPVQGTLTAIATGLQAYVGLAACSGLFMSDAQRVSRNAHDMSEADFSSIGLSTDLMMSVIGVHTRWTHFMIPKPVYRHPALHT